MVPRSKHGVRFRRLVCLGERDREGSMHVNRAVQSWEERGGGEQARRTV